MLDRILKNALEGVTVIEEETGSVARILSKQMGGFAEAAGKKVEFVSLESQEGEFAGIQGASGVEERAIGETRLRSRITSKDKEYVLPEGLGHDLVIIDSFSTYLFDKSERQAVDLINRIGKLARAEKRGFIITFDKALLSNRLAAFLEATADSVIIIHTEVTSDRVTRMLYIPKLKDSKPLDRLIKITVDENGLQVDTREFVG
jgi:KaiC/GvpD/RAD55 family RecA-like ATPase